MSDWATLNKGRVPQSVDKRLGTTPQDGFNGAFALCINGLNVWCIASDGEGWQHVSVSIYGSAVPPSWSIMCKVKDLFWEEDQVVVQFHPAKSQYINCHPGCLHLWRSTKQVQPVPDPAMVGPRPNPPTIEPAPGDQNAP